MSFNSKFIRFNIQKMDIQTQINEYISTQLEAKRNDMEILHKRILELNPSCKLWFLDGKNSKNKVVCNPNIGYGIQTIRYADGKSKEFYRVGLSANTTGISVYILGIEDKNYLSNTYKENLGKASITGYCIKFKKLKDINLEVLETAIQFGFSLAD